MYLIYTITILSFSIFCQPVTAQKTSIKTSIDNELFGCAGILTNSKIDSLVAHLTKFTSNKNNLCFITIGDYNNCSESKKGLYSHLKHYLNDLIGKPINGVELVKWNKPWGDEEFYSLTYKLHYLNEDLNFPVELNWDTITFDINEEQIINIIYSREWINLNSYGLKNG